MYQCTNETAVLKSQFKHLPEAWDDLHLRCQTLEIETLTHERLSVRHLSVVMHFQSLSLPSNMLPIKRCLTLVAECVN